MSSIGERLQNARIKRNLTQKQLADIMGCAKGTIQQYELNKRSPDIPTLKKLVKVLDISTTYLLDGGEEVEWADKRLKRDFQGVFNDLRFKQTENHFDERAFFETTQKNPLLIPLLQQYGIHFELGNYGLMTIHCNGENKEENGMQTAENLSILATEIERLIKRTFIKAYGFTLKEPPEPIEWSVDNGETSS